MTCRTFKCPNGRNAIVCGPEYEIRKSGWSLYSAEDYKDGFDNICHWENRKMCVKRDRCLMDFHPMGHIFNPEGHPKNPDEIQKKVGRSNLDGCRKVKVVRNQLVGRSK